VDGAEEFEVPLGSPQHGFGLCDELRGDEAAIGQASAIREVECGLPGLVYRPPLCSAEGKHILPLEAAMGARPPRGNLSAIGQVS